MPQSQVFTLDHADEYQAAIRAGTYEVFVKSKGDFHAQLTRIDLQRLWMQRGETNLPWIMNAANDPERAPLLFLDRRDSVLPLGGNEAQLDVGPQPPRNHVAHT